jgi:hypothetical protein
MTRSSAWRANIWRLAGFAWLRVQRQGLGMIQAADIEQMSLEGRHQAMELLWASLARMPDAVPSPDWHREVLAARLAKVERGEGGIPHHPSIKGTPAEADRMRGVVVLAEAAEDGRFELFQRLLPPRKSGGVTTCRCTAGCP